MSAAPTKLVSYRRVSTKTQGESGLGLEGQEMDVERYRAGIGGVILREFTEVETGTKKRDRPVLRDALRHCKRTGATLVIAKLDRLSRNVHFLTGLMEGGVDFVCCDMPDANPLTLHIMAAVAEDEARRISERVKKALGAYKANKRVSKRLRELHPDGVPPELVDATAGKLGASLPQCRNLTDDARRRGSEAMARIAREEAIRDNAHLTPRLLAWKAEGRSLRAIAAELNAEGETTRSGAPWSATAVMRTLDRVATT